MQSELRTFEIDQDWMAIRGNQSSAPLRSTKIGWLVMRSASARTSGVCSVAEKRSVCSRPPVRPTGGSFTIRGNQRQSEAIRGNQRQSELLTCPTDRRQLRMQFEDRVEMSRVEQPVSFVEHEELRGRERGGGVSRERRKRSQSEALRH